MSKKNRRKFQLSGQVNASAAPAAPRPVSAQNQHAAEYRIIRNDLVRVVIVNLVFLAGVLAIYFTNQKSNYLQQLYERIF